MSQWFTKAWQQGHPLLWLLAPLTLLFVVVSTVRRWCYHVGIFNTPKLDVPVIVVGNISVGGNGKTPTVLYLVELLKSAGYRPGIISRGYGGQSDSYPLQVNADTPASQSGDEPALMFRRAQVSMAVGPDRVAAAKLLIDSGEVDVIVSDDGMQHYRLARVMEVAVVDGERRFGNGWRLPMGPLRESPSRLQKCDLVICNGGAPQQGENLMTLAPGEWQRVDGQGKGQGQGDGEGQGEELPPMPSVAIAGIGYPQRFFNTLETLNIKPQQCIGFADHQDFDQQSLVALTRANQSLLMTEKDAVKCQSFAEANWYYLPVTARLAPDFDTEFLRIFKEKSHGVRR